MLVLKPKQIGWSNFHAQTLSVYAQLTLTFVRARNFLAAHKLLAYSTIFWTLNREEHGFMLIPCYKCVSDFHHPTNWSSLYARDSAEISRIIKRDVHQAVNKIDLAEQGSETMEAEMRVGTPSSYGG
ncbi:hypothetical protein BDQ17DRAFT_1333349 [Cyathus striatus]|nr:hypothetical protein BDQ17DRAFT_1333349 [Cyathus striatus]